MTEDSRSLERLLVVKIIRLNAVAQGIVTGLILGLGLFAATLWLVAKGGPVVGPHLGLLGNFFIGYRVTVAGAFIGFAYAFVLGFIIGYFVTTTYNWLIDLRQSRVGHRP